MAGIPLIDKIASNNNASHTDVFRTYVKDNFDEIRKNCTVLTVQGRSSTRYQNNSHALWIELGLDPKYCMIADFLNGIDGDTSLMYLTSIYLPDTNYLDSISRRINRGN